MRLHKEIIHSLGRRYIDRITESEARHQKFKRGNERGIEYSFVFRHIASFFPKTVLDVGVGKTALPALIRTCGPVVTAIDNVHDYWPKGMLNRHWHVVDDDITKSHLTGPYDMVICVSALEHMTDHQSAMRHMFRLLSPSGHLVLTCPYTDKEFVDNVYTIPGARQEFHDLAYGCRSYSRGELNQWLSQGNVTLVEQEFWRIETGRCHALGEWLFPPVRVNNEELHQLSCLLFRKNE